MNETGHSTIVPLMAFKGWLLAIQAQITGVVHGIDDQILFHENEIKQLKGQRERSRSAYIHGRRSRTRAGHPAIAFRVAVE